MNQDKDDFPNEIMYPAGLTKREYAAIHIMAGAVSNDRLYSVSSKRMAEHAVNYTNALFKELDNV